MSKSPVATITHVTIFGNRNAGKSSLFNAILNQDIAIVDTTLGTTTDPVHKRIELLPFGPILLTDTAGIDDIGEIGQKRVEKVRKMFARSDFGIVMIDATSNEYDLELESELKSFDINYVKVFNKINLISEDKLLKIKSDYPNALFINTQDINSILDFKTELINLLGVKIEKSIVGTYLQPGDNVVLVVPVDSEAPKGRIILPQVQVIRDLLDFNVNAIVTNEVQLENVLKNRDDIALVITDSQAFSVVSKIVPEEMYLTSFSILFAHYKSNLSNYKLNLDDLTNINNILICESCTHNVGHEDIGMFKIPKLLRKRFGENVNIKHIMGNDFVSNVEQFDLIIHCGSCMLNDSVLKYRINIANTSKVAFTNYGLYLAYESGIIDRSIKFFLDNKIIDITKNKV